MVCLPDDHREKGPLVVTDQELGGPEKGRFIFMNIFDYSLLFCWASWDSSDEEAS